MSGEEVDGLLTAFFQLEMPNPWPSAPTPWPVIARKKRRPSRLGSRLALATSVGILFLANLLAFNGFRNTNGPRPAAGPMTLEATHRHFGQAPTMVPRPPSFSKQKQVLPSSKRLP
jgi:hypothetical protein